MMTLNLIIFCGDVICKIAIYADDPSLYSKCDQASDLWQQLELASEFEFDLLDTTIFGLECPKNTTCFI